MLYTKQQLCTCITLVCTFLCPFLYDYDVKMPDMEYVKQRRNLFLFLNLNVVPRNSTPRGFACIWQSKWVRIIAIKTERTQIHFLSDVLVEIASLDLKVPDSIVTKSGNNSMYCSLAKSNQIRFLPNVLIIDDLHLIN